MTSSLNAYITLTLTLTRGSKYIVIPTNSNMFSEENVSRVAGQTSLTPWGKQNSLTS